MNQPSQSDRIFASQTTTARNILNTWYATSFLTHTNITQQGETPLYHDTYPDDDNIDSDGSSSDSEYERNEQELYEDQDAHELDEQHDTHHRVSNNEAADDVDNAIDDEQHDLPEDNDHEALDDDSDEPPITEQTMAAMMKNPDRSVPERLAKNKRTNASLLRRQLQVTEKKWQQIRRAGVAHYVTEKLDALSAKGLPKSWRYKDPTHVQNAIDKLEKQFPILAKAEDHWAAIYVLRSHGNNIADDVTRRTKIHTGKARDNTTPATRTPAAAEKTKVLRCIASTH